MAGFRVLNDGRLHLPDGRKLDLEHGWLSKDEAVACASSADSIVLSTGLATIDISTDRERIARLLALVDGRQGDVGGRRYKGSGILALVLHDFH